MVGTVSYASPEQCLGRPTDVRSEIYSLACVVYEAFFGVPPFLGADHLELMQKQVLDVPSFSSAILRNPSQSLVELLSRGLKKNPGSRFDAVADFAEELKTCDLTESDSEHFTRAPSISAYNYKPTKTQPDRGLLYNLLLLSTFAIFGIAIAMGMFNGAHHQSQALHDQSSNGENTTAPRPDGNKDWHALMSEALTSFNAQDVGKARELLIRALEKCPNTTDQFAIWIKLAACNQAMAENKLALEQRRSAYRLFVENQSCKEQPDACGQLAKLFAESGDKSKARELWGTAATVSLREGKDLNFAIFMRKKAQVELSPLLSKQDAHSATESLLHSEKTEHQAKFEELALDYYAEALADEKLANAAENLKVHIDHLNEGIEACRLSLAYNLIRTPKVKYRQTYRLKSVSKITKALSNRLEAAMVESEKGAWHASANH